MTNDATDDQATGPVPPHFTRIAGGFESLPAAEGRWAPGTLSGPAVNGLLAQVLDTEFGDGFVAARWRCDLFRMVRAGRIEVQTTLVRSGRRICVAEAELIQDGRQVVRAAATFYRPAPQPDGDVWSAADPTPPPHGAARLSLSCGDDDYYSVESNLKWDNAERKRMWAVGWRVLDDDSTTAFARAAMIADCTNMVTAAGTKGVQTINSDVSLALVRAPIGDEIGLETDQHLLVDGVSAGAASMFDRHGRFGVCTVSGIATGSAVDNLR